jgi:ABC-type sugar transport system ATPase subunit
MSAPDDSAAKRPPPLLEMREIAKSYPGVRALTGVGLHLHTHEVLAVMGENGAGKSTLIKVLAGAVQADSGSIWIDGIEVHLHDPKSARDEGIAVIYQEFNLVPTLTIPENLFLGRDITRNGLLDKREETSRAEALFHRLGVTLDLSIPCKDLSTAQQQLVEIARALADNARIVVMDEPSASLSPHEVERLHAIVRELRSRGIAIIYISHRLEEVFAIADRVLFLRDGKPAGEANIQELTRSRMIECMVGRALKDEHPPRNTVPGDAVVLEVQNLCRGNMVRSVSFQLHSGEILALTGLVGSGRTETARLIFGADQPESGTILRNGVPVTFSSPADAVAAGIGLLPEDRKSQGLILDQTILDNFALPNLEQFAASGLIAYQKIRALFARFRAELKIKAPSVDTPASSLSGGNQQKVVLAKWLARQCQILIFDEPTRGVDVGAKFEIYTLMRRLVAQGVSILMISSEMPEVLGLADRILVMHDGRVTGEIRDVPGATQELLMQLAIA